MENLNKLYLVLAWLISHFLPTKKLVYFSSFFGQYNDNPRQISEKLHELSPNTPIYWAKSKRNHVNFPDYVKTVDISSFRHYIMMYTSRVTVDNQVGMRSFSVGSGWFKRWIAKIIIRSPHSQLNIGTWHGTPLKKIGVDSLDFELGDIKYCPIKYSVAGCLFTEKCLKSAFPKAFELRRYGTPRNDIFFRKNDDIKIKNRLKLPIEKKILLFAPTFRMKLDMSGPNQIEILNWDTITKLLSSKFGGEWVVVVRLHPHVMDSINIEFSELIVNGNYGDDMAEYLVVSDALLTDYSSSLFDYALSKNPCFLYASDLNEYSNNERGLYWEYEDLPFPKACTPSDLYSCIQKFDETNYRIGITQFLAKIGNFEDGNASKRIVMDILEEFKQIIGCKNINYESASYGHNKDSKL